VAVGDSIVIGSTQSDGSLPYLAVTDVSSVRRVIATANASAAILNFTSTLAWSSAASLDSQRFQIVDGTQNAVTYACVGTLNTLSAAGGGQAQLIRYWNYGFNAAQVLPTTGSSAILADNVSACAIDYEVVNQRNGLLAITLKITKNNETVSLYEEIHVNNAP
jgi:MSHA biogenesis protein MshO